MLGWLKRWNRGATAWSVRRFGRYTDRARKSMAVANARALARGCEEISPEDLLWAVMGDEVGPSVGKSVMICRRVDIEKLRERLGPVNGVDLVVRRKLPMNAALKQVVERAIGEARELKDNYVGTEHLLGGLTLVERTREVLAEFGMTHGAWRTGLHLMRAQLAQSESRIVAAKRELEKALSHEPDAVALNDAAWLLARGTGCSMVRGR